MVGKVPLRQSGRVQGTLGTQRALLPIHSILFGHTFPLHSPAAGSARVKLLMYLVQFVTWIYSSVVMTHMWQFQELYANFGLKKKKKNQVYSYFLPLWFSQRPRVWAEALIEYTGIATCDVGLRWLLFPSPLRLPSKRNSLRRICKLEMGPKHTIWYTYKFTNLNMIRR